MKMPKILMGCDPELFVTTPKGLPRSAHGLVPGTKKEPFKVNKGAIQVDGMALEFNIDPAKTEDEFVTNIQTVMQELRAKVPPKFKFLIEPSVKFSKSIMDKAPDEAKELGCEPDLSAYTLKENPKPNANTNMRTASGHIHIGLEKDGDVKSEEHLIKYATLVKHLDLFLGVRSLEWDKDKKRRQLYGNPGAMRLKPYGVEYRVLSNKWLEKEELVRFVYKQVVRCIEDLLENGALSDNDYKHVCYDIQLGVPYKTKKKFLMSKKGYAACLAANELQIGA